MSLTASQPPASLFELSLSRRPSPSASSSLSSESSLGLSPSLVSSSVNSSPEQSRASHQASPTISLSVLFVRNSDQYIGCHGTTTHQQLELGANSVCFEFISVYVLLLSILVIVPGYRLVIIAHKDGNRRASFMS